jgi:hypothetical protein
MNIAELKSYIKDLPDDMDIVIMDWPEFIQVEPQFSTNRVFFQ